MNIRRAVVSDFGRVADLDRRAWDEYPQPEIIPDGEHVWRLWIEHGLVFCAEEGEEIVGAIVAFPCRSGTYCVHKAFVERRRRGQRIGTELFRALLSELDEMQVDAFLTVTPTNEAAIRLYERWGFTERLFVQGYYRPTEDRYVLTRRAVDGRPPR